MNLEDKAKRILELAEDTSVTNDWKNASEFIMEVRTIAPELAKAYLDIMADNLNLRFKLLDTSWREGDELDKHRIHNKKMREALTDLLNSEALKEAPFYNYSEAVLRARQILKECE